MLEGILGLAHKLNLEAIAEGIEDPAQLALLRGLGCRLGQGYLLARPGPAPAIEALLASGARLQPPAGSGESQTPEAARGPDFLLHGRVSRGVLPQGIIENRQQCRRGPLNATVVLGVFSGGTS